MHVGRYIPGFGLCTLGHSLSVGNDNCSRPSGLTKHYTLKNTTCLVIIPLANEA